MVRLRSRCDALRHQVGPRLKFISASRWSISLVLGYRIVRRQSGRRLLAWSSEMTLPYACRAVAVVTGPPGPLHCYTRLLHTAGSPGFGPV